MSGRKEGTPDRDWQDVDLLDCVDNALRNGSHMTRANLAFRFLLERFGYEHSDLPGYAADMAELEEADEEQRRKDADMEWAATVNPYNEENIR